MSIFRRRFVIAMVVCALGCFNGSKAYASFSGTEAPQQNITPRFELVHSNEQGDAVTGQSLMALAGLHARSGVVATDSSDIQSGLSMINDSSAESPLFGQDINIVSTFPRHSPDSGFNGAAIQVPADDINLVPVPPAIFTGAITLAGLLVVRGIKRIRSESRPQFRSTDSSLQIN